MTSADLFIALPIVATVVVFFYWAMDELGTHTSFLCPLCGVSFGDRPSLDKHMTAEGEKEARTAA